MCNCVTILLKKLPFAADSPAAFVDRPNPSQWKVFRGILSQIHGVCSEYRVFNLIKCSLSPDVACILAKFGRSPA